MSRKQKIIVIAAASFAVLCLVACGVTLFFFKGIGNAITDSQIKSPVEADAAARQIATFDLPAGYSATEGMKLLGMTMVIYKANNTNTFIMFMELPAAKELNDTDISQMQGAFDRQYGGSGSQMKVVSTRDLTVRGKAAKLIVMEGATKNVAMRQVILYFMGNHGLASVFITGPVSQWNASAYDKLILSIR